jgi:hypothetical protein
MRFGRHRLGKKFGDGQRRGCRGRVERRTGICALGFGGCRGRMARAAFHVSESGAVGREHAIGGWLGARMFLGLSRPDR